MDEVERAVLSLPPVLQRRMAKLVLLGWRIERKDGLYGYAWKATPPEHDGPAWGRTEATTLLTLLDKLVGYDVVPDDEDMTRAVGRPY